MTGNIGLNHPKTNAGDRPWRRFKAHPANNQPAAVSNDYASKHENHTSTNSTKARPPSSNKPPNDKPAKYVPNEYDEMLNDDFPIDDLPVTEEELFKSDLHKSGTQSSVDQNNNLATSSFANFSVEEADRDLVTASLVDCDLDEDIDIESQENRKRGEPSLNGDLQIDDLSMDHLPMDDLPVSKEELFQNGLHKNGAVQTAIKNSKATKLIQQQLPYAYSSTASAPTIESITPRSNNSRTKRTRSIDCVIIDDDARQREV